ETGAQLRSDGFDQQINDLAAGQEQIVVRMRSALNVSLAGIEAARSLRERPSNPTAFDLVLQARAVNLLPQTKETIARALALYEQALQRDPNALLALTGMAQMQLNALFYGMLPYDVASDRAGRYLERAKSVQADAEPFIGLAAARPRLPASPPRV